MSLVDKLREIINTQKKFLNTEPGEFAKPIDVQQIRAIESLLGEALPDEFVTLYSFANGQVADSDGILFGERFMNAEEIAAQLKISLSFVKPENKRIVNKERSDNLLRVIADFFVEKSIKRNLLGFKKNWHKIEFKCGLDSYEGPYLYTDINTTENKRELVEINYDALSTISGTIQELHELEKEHYNWDQLAFVVFSNNEYKVERTFYDFDNQINFTSNPENAIRKKYFHYKWIPVFSDYGGNYIGIDLDPDINGKKGQIIIFGRDEEDMVVLADSLGEFFDFLLLEMKKPGNNLINSGVHLHDTLKALKK